MEREIGQGGMATVYLADDLKHRRKVAIKVLRSELGSLLGPERFTQEIEVVAGLTHPHIVPLYDSGEADGLLFFVMPYVRGESLREKLTREKQLTVAEAIGIIRQVAAALDHFHAHGLVHRDLKPANILMHEGEAMVTDFGIALPSGALPEKRITRSGVMVGTPSYMSPEQAAGERTLDGRSDVYSLGVMLYEMLAGEPPYTGPTAQAVIAKRFTDPVPSIRRLRPAVPVAVDEAIKKALANVPADRFPSGGAMVEALTAPVAAPKSPSVAVLPFLNFSADPENEFFADGITEDVIAQLSKIRSLKVISHTSVMRFKKRELSLKEIGARLDAANLLEGSVRRAGSRVRIVAQLIDAENDRHLWAETYDRDLTDIFAIQSDVALQIAAALEAELSPEERTRIKKQPTDDVQAYQSYLMGKHCFIRWTEEGFDQAIKHFDQAIARDKDYAPAYAGLGYVYTEIGIGVAGSLPPEEAFRKAKAAVDKALELDPELAEAHVVLAHLMMSCDYDWAGAEAEYRRAIELNPNSGISYDSYGLMLSSLERYDEALAAQERAHELDPVTHRMDIATTYLRAGRYDEAVRAITACLEVDPYLALGHATQGWAYLLTGKPEQGIASLRRAVSISPDSTLYLAQLGQALARTGQTDEAREILRQLNEMSAQRYVSPYHMAYVYTGLGEYDRAMDYLEQAYEARSGGIFGVKGSFLFAPLRGQERFQALLRKMNLG
ncbi:MAG TPA: protein kinase [Gemmatimonadales bacterium]